MLLVVRTCDLAIQLITEKGLMMKDQYCVSYNIIYYYIKKIFSRQKLLQDILLLLAFLAVLGKSTIQLFEKIVTNIYI